MPSNGERAWACDTSVAIAALDPLHVNHRNCRTSVRKFQPALAGHAAFESFSVLTRLPLPLRLKPDQAVRVLRQLFPERCWLDADATAALFDRVAELGIAGGAVYDALVAEAARVNDRVLLTVDRRATNTYQAVGVEFLLLEAQ